MQYTVGTPEKTEQTQFCFRRISPSYFSFGCHILYDQFINKSRKKKQPTNNGVRLGQTARSVRVPLEMKYSVTLNQLITHPYIFFTKKSVVKECLTT